MDHIMSFFAWILLFTGGLAVTIFWIAGLVLISIEGYDLIKETYFTPTKNEDDF